MENAAAVPSLILDQLPHGVLILDNDLNAVGSNRLALELLGIPVENLLNESLPQLLKETPFFTLFRDTAVAKTRLRQTTLFLDGRHLQLTFCFPAPEIPGQTNLVVTIDDITHFKQMETIKSEFISILLHKIRNPLTSVKTSLTMLNSGMVTGLTADAREILEMSSVEINRLNNLLNDLRNTFAIDTDLLFKELDVETGEIIKVIYRAIEDVSSAAEDPEAAKRRFAIEGDLATFFLGDFDKIKQALGYILKNAFQYSDGKTKIRIRIQREVDAVLISIQDKGIGIAETALPHIYDKFYRTETALLSGVEGNGLGLYIAKSFIEASGGSLYCESGENTGTTFFITLPRN